MPRLYRMPVFYLAALSLAAAVALGSWGRRGPEPPTEPTRAENPAVPPAPTPAATVADEPSDGILRTADGLRRKVVVKDLDVVCRSDAEGGRSIGEPLDYFSIHFLYGESPPDAPKMLQIGPREGPPRGWVPVGSVLEWDTRLMAKPTPSEGRPPLVMYREESCLRDAVRKAACPKHDGHCPIEGEEPGQSSDAALGLPILQSKAARRPDGSSATIFEVASLVRDQAPVLPPAEPPDDLRPLLKRIYIAFAIDTTASMQASIVAARAMATRLVDDASRRYRDVVLKLALVEYRDEAPAYGFKVQRVTGFTDPVGFRAALDRIEAAKQGDGSVDEAVLDGVAAALPTPPGEPPGEVHLDWPSGRVGDLATKLLVLLGDAPDHARDLDRAGQLAAWARRRGITIAAVTIDRPDLSRDERSRYQAQWHALAEGSFRPRDKARGFKEPSPPIELSLARAGELVPRLQAVIDDRVEHARNLAALAAAEAEGRLAQYANSQGLTLDRIAPVLVDLHRGESRPTPRPDPRLNGRKAPSVRRGWIAERLDGAPLVTIGMLMSRSELDTLIAELSALERAAQGTARDLSELLRIGTAAASGETAFLAADRGDQTFADHLRRRQGLPPARPDSLLRRRQADLLQADDLYRSALVARLRSGIAQLLRRRDAPDWDDPRRTADGMALVPYAAIDF
jgi:hypothetical protein